MLSSLREVNTNDEGTKREEEQVRYVYPLFHHHHQEKEEDKIIRKVRTYPRKRKFQVNNISKNEKFIRIPKLLRTDIRKKYPIMILNVLNGCNYRNIFDFLRLFCDDNVKMAWNMTHCNTSPNFELSLSTTSSKCVAAFDRITPVVNYLFFCGLLVPDRIHEMIQSEIFTRSDSLETRIEIYYRMSGTLTYQCFHPQVAEIIQSYHRSSSPISSESFSDDGEDCSQSIVPYDNEFSLYKLFYQQIERKEVPISISSNGKVTLIIDNYRESMKINNILFESLLSGVRLNS